MTRRQSGASQISFNNSSDPAVFSSDDDPALDNYVEGRQKRRYLGSWFQHQQQLDSSDSTFSEPTEQPKPKRTLVRQVDSGVFLGSDGTDMGDLPELEIPTHPKLPQLQRAISTRLTEPELKLQKEIRESVDCGVESIDFWSMGLEQLSGEVIAPLAHFVRVPRVMKDVAFEQKDPQLKLILANNRLNRLPGALFDVTNLTVLSVRNNRLTELPPAIGKLRNLVELNIAQNRLQHLPVELLNLFNADCKLSTLHMHPNWFLHPDEGGEKFQTVEEVSGVHVPSDYILDTEPEPLEFPHGSEVPDESLPRLISRRLGRSPLQISDSSGRILSTFKMRREWTQEPLETEAVYKKQLRSYGQGFDLEGRPVGESKAIGERNESNGTRVPSLLEAVMRSCAQSAHLAELKSFVPEEFSNIRQLFDRALEQKDIGGLTCSTCEKTMVVPVLEWIEWREVNKPTKFRNIKGKYRLDNLSDRVDEIIVPFHHRACSWRCGPKHEHSGWQFPKGCQGMTVRYCLYNKSPAIEG